MNTLFPKLRASYDRIAASFAEHNATIPPAVLASAQRLLTYLPADSQLLDVGCGHGRETEWFVSHGFDVTAFDLSAGMLHEAGKRTQQARIQGDMLRLPFASQAFDALWCNAALLHIPKTQTHGCLAGFRRILKQNGVLYMALQAGSGEVWESQAYGMETPRFFARYSFDEGAQLVESAGFHILEHSEHKREPRAHWLHYIARLNA